MRSHTPELFRGGINYDELLKVLEISHISESLDYFNLERYYNQRPDLLWIKYYVSKLYSKQVRHIKNIYTISGKHNIIVTISPPPNPFPPINYQINETIKKEVKEVLEEEKRQKEFWKKHEGKSLSEVRAKELKKEKEREKEKKDENDTDWDEINAIVNEVSSIKETKGNNLDKKYTFDKSHYYIKFTADDTINILDIKKGKRELFMELYYAFSWEMVHYHYLQEEGKREDEKTIKYISQIPKINLNTKMIAYEFKYKIKKEIPSLTIKELMEKIVEGNYDKSKLSTVTSRLLNMYQYCTDVWTWSQLLSQLQKNLSSLNKRTKKEIKEKRLANYEEWLKNYAQILTV